jgi:pilus assembly protein CpaF
MSPAAGGLIRVLGDVFCRSAAAVFRHAVNIRKFVLRAATLHDIVELGSLPAAAARFLDASVRAGLNILVAGGTQAG